MLPRRSPSRTLCVLAACLSAGPLAAGAGNDWFETQVRPILAKQCYACHTQTEMGGLRVDSRERLLKGGKTGPAIQPGNAAASLLIQAVDHSHPRLKMPPQRKIKPEEAAILRDWVGRGAPWPNVEPGAGNASLWSLQPIRKVATPQPSNLAWARTAIDRFILARLESEGMKPSPLVDRRTWIRRVAFDLTGLPPTPEEVRAFLADSSPNAYGKAADRFLSSPHYGERWARHWLDLARYSDGSQGARDDTPYPNAFRYRDWVISALNRDLPYDVFVKAQVAADQMPDPALLPALGFQTIGESDNDRVDVTTRVLLGLTVGCAQCHDHKYDPIPTRDYYSLLGVFRSSKVEEHPLVGPDAVAAYKKAKKVSEDKQAELKRFTDRHIQQLVDVLASQTEQYVMAAWKVLARPGTQAGEVASQSNLDAETLERWVRYLSKPGKEHPYFGEWFSLLEQSGQAARMPEAEVRRIARRIHESVAEVLAEKKAIEDRNYVKLGGIEGMKDEGKVIATLVDALPIERYYFWRDLASGPYKVEDIRFPGGVYYYSAKEIDRFLGPQWKRYYEQLRKEAESLKKGLPEQYPFWHVLADQDKPANVKIAVRGDPSNPGEEAPRQFLSALCGDHAKPFTKGSGRLELAEAIAAHPVTARVMVNRIWKHHFGEGLVRSVSNFGRLGDRPTHPELLEYLAARFIESGWSIKAMHREMVVSAAYQMASAEQPAEYAARDPENRLLWRSHARERLDAEALRDSVLAVAGTLDRAVGGPPKPLTDDGRRRTVYVTISRSQPNRTLALFDFPDPNATSEQRAVTVGPMQRLFFLNSRFILQQAKAFAERLERDAGAEDRARIRRAYELAFGRPAKDQEVSIGLDYLARHRDAWPKYAQVLLGTAEFSAIQ